MAVDDGTLYPAQKELLKNLLGFLGMAHKRNVLAMLRMQFAAFNPAAVYLRFLQDIAHSLVGINYHAFGIGYSGTYKQTRHTLAHAVLYAVARVYYQGSFVLFFLQKLHRTCLPAHVQYHGIVNGAGDELLLAIDIHLATALAQLLGNKIKNSGIVSYMVGRESTRPHYTCDFNFSHIYML